jgi:transcriptional regulator with XRE-family HTH domain
MAARLDEVLDAGGDLVKDPTPAGSVDTPAAEAPAPVAARRASPPKPLRNDLLRRARVSVASPSGSGDPMSRQELAEAINAYLHSVGVMSFLDGHDIGRYERGETRWPRAHYRRALRTVLGAATDAQLGFFSTRPSPSNAEPFEIAEPGGGLGEPAGSQVNGAALTPPPVATPVPPPLVPRPPVTQCAALAPPVGQTRVVLHWTGRKAYALRIAMRLNLYDFAAKLGVSIPTARAWQEDATGRLRFETYQLLDTMLSLATEDDVRRFDLALREMGETRRS